MIGARILVVDDEPDIRRLVKEILEDESYVITTAENAARAREALAITQPDLMLLDIWMPDTDGMELLRELSGHEQMPCPVIMMSGHGNIETAVDALRLGAYDFIEKPVSMAKLLVTVQRALQAEQLRRENISLRRRISGESDIIGSSQIMQDLEEDLRRVGATDSWVLISGEPGTGKAVAARYIHEHSARKERPLVEISLAATPRENVAVQLFGSEEEGVVVAGCFEQAAGGTLLLDEIGDLDLETQSRLISALQERRFLRVGGRTPIAMDVRMIATTRHDLSAAVKEGRFREDLFYRLNVVPIHTPPLRRRVEDIDLLCNHYLRWMVEHERLPEKRLTPDAVAVLKHYHWPGNVRELKNVIQRLVILGRSGEIGAGEVQKALGSEPGETVTGQAENFDQEMRLARDEFERAYLLYHLQRNGGNVTALAETSGMERTHLYRKLKQLGIHPKAMKQK